MVGSAPKLNIFLGLTARSQGCGMRYQRVEVEPEDVVQPQTVGTPKAKTFTKKRKRQEASDSDDEPSQFCRVRLRYRKLRTRCWFCGARFETLEDLEKHYTATDHSPAENRAWIDKNVSGEVRLLERIRRKPPEEKRGSGRYDEEVKIEITVRPFPSQLEL